MKWTNLKSNTCPKCRSSLFNATDPYSCGSGVCDFRIGKKKFEEIVNNLYKTKAQQRDNASEWNNYGHEKVTEDFSDSPHI